MMYNIKKTTEIELKKINWENVEPMQLVNNDGSENCEYSTKAYLLYNDNGIFFRYVCEDDKINATMTEYNAPIYEEETVEFFFSQDCDPHNYLELEWNAVGGVFCAEVYNDLNGNTSLKYVNENIISTEITPLKDGYWTVQGYIPKALFKKPLSGEWLFNAYRIKRRKDNSMILSAYSPTFIENFHKPNYFSRLNFV